MLHHYYPVHKLHEIFKLHYEYTTANTRISKLSFTIDSAAEEEEESTDANLRFTTI